MRTERLRLLFALFREMFLLSACVIGGGYVILSVADARFSKKRAWIRPGELFEVLPLFQMIPGIIGGHVANYVGNRVAGGWGALVAVSGLVLPSILIFLAVSVLYRSIPMASAAVATLFLGLRSALAGILLDMTLRTWRKSVTGAYGICTFACALLAMSVVRVPPAWVIALSLLVGVAVTFVRERPTGGASEPRRFNSFWALPLLFFGYGLIAFGGGYVLVPVYLRDFVGASAPYLHLDPHDFANVMALTEMTPGPIAVNCATFFGYLGGGVAGAVATTVALVLPGSVILWLALRSLERFRTSRVVRGIFFGVRPVTAALLAGATWAFLGMSAWRFEAQGFAFSPLGSALVVLTFVLVRRRWLGAVPAILLAALLALVASRLATGWF